MVRFFLLLLTASLLSSCGSDLEPESEPAPYDGEVLVSSVENEDGTKTTTVTAFSESVWVFFDLDTAQQTAEESAGWDLAFRRFQIVGNGSTGVSVAWAEGNDLDPSKVPNEEAFVLEPVDRSDESIDAGTFQAAAGEDDPWYRYDLSTHSLAPHERVYYVRSNEGRLFGLIFTDYYDQAGTSGYPTFRWGPIDR